MVSRTIPLIDERRALRALPGVARVLPIAAPTIPSDTLGRPLKDLRISVTDRCNFRCGYCMPRSRFEGHQFLPHSDILSFEEITRAASLFMRLGVTKLRLTGGEPLLRKNLEALIAQLAGLRTLDGQAPELTLTTNGSLLRRKAQALKSAGLQRITISLDAMDDAVFRQMNDADFPVQDVLDGIEAAQAAGLAPIKVNMVVRRGINDHQIPMMARHFRHTGIELRFIEYMDVGSTNGWVMDEVLPSDEVIKRVAGYWPLAALAPERAGETAQRLSYVDGGGSIGVVSSVTQAFCGTCNRARLSTDGQIYLCLFAHHGFDLRAPLRSGTSDDSIVASLALLWSHREDRYSQQRGLQSAGQPLAADAPAAPRVEMSFIGG